MTLNAYGRHLITFGFDNEATPASSTSGSGETWFLTSIAASSSSIISRLIFPLLRHPSDLYIYMHFRFYNSSRVNQNHGHGVKCGIYGANSAEWIMSMQDQTQSFELPIKKRMYTYHTFHSHILFLGPLRRYSYGMVLQLVSGVGFDTEDFFWGLLEEDIKERQ
ncbi:hypothetical protein JHK86_052512 [Glycine max]|nr:hypothetical protein JHK86_052512 [Glycine max]